MNYSQSMDWISGSHGQARYDLFMDVMVLCFVFP